MPFICQDSFPALQSTIHAAAFSDCLLYLATAGEDGSLIVWDWTYPGAIPTEVRLEDSVLCLEWLFSSSSEWTIVCGLADGSFVAVDYHQVSSPVLYNLRPLTTSPL